MKPILYKATETAFDTNGIGVLGDCVSCTVTEERNGLFELEMRYPIKGIHYSEIAQRSIIAAMTCPGGTIQPFRVYEISRPLNGIVTVYAQHLSYDLDGIPVNPFKATSASSAMSGLKSNAAVTCPFSFTTDKTTGATMNVTFPKTIWDLLSGSEGGVLDVYGGEYEFDKYSVKLHSARGADNGVTIRYGKNLTDIKQDENCASVYTGVYPYWVDPEGSLTVLPEKIVNVAGTFDFVRVKPIDFSADYEEQPTESTLRAAANAYISNNQIGSPKVSLKVAFEPLEQVDEYQDIAILEHVNLCDIVSVVFPDLGVSSKAKVIETKYDVLLDRYKSVELGDARESLAKTIVKQEKKIAQQEDELASKPNTSDVNNIASNYADSALDAANSYTDTATSEAIKESVNRAAANTTLQIENYDEYMTQLEIFNRLTNNGATQGIFMENGKLYINVDYARAGTLDAAYVNLDGKFYVYNGSSLGGYIGYMTGYDGSSTTYGVGLGAAGGNYIIVTNGGARLQGGGNSVYATDDECGVSGKLSVYGDLEVHGNITASGTVSGSNITS